MKQLVRLLAGALLASLPFVGISSLAVAQDKGKDAKAAPAAPAAKAEKGKATIKTLLDHDKARAVEVIWKPGDVNESIPTSSFRVTHVIKGGTLERTYVDGKTEKVEWKTGEVRMTEPSTQKFTNKNIGKTEIVFYVVILKEPKK